MKKFRVFLFVLVVFLSGTISAFSVPDSCLTLIYPNTPDNYNPDGICKDTCKNSPTYGQWFQQGTWIIAFKQYIFLDSIRKAGGAFIGNIDSVKFPNSYSAIKLIEQKFGKITFFRDPDICNNRFDEAFYVKPCLAVFFEEYCNSADVNDNLNKIPDIRYVMLRNVPHGTDVSEEDNNSCIEIKQNPCFEKLIIKNCSLIINNNKNLLIYNILGEKVIDKEIQYENELTEIDISSLNEGIYFIKLNNKILKFIKY
jgi:hypothetical protein